VSERPLAVLDTLGEELRRLGEPSARRRGLTRRTVLIGLVLMLLLAGVAAAAILIARGAPLSAPNAKDLQASGVPLPATVRLAGLDASDPDSSQPAWDIRLSHTRAGETCTAVGQVLGGEFGIVGLDRVFRALPLGGVDACGVSSPGGPVLAGARVFVGSGSQGARTVVNGVAGAQARSVTVYGPGGARSLRLGAQGSFITVYRGYVEEVRPRVVVVTADGRTHTVSFAQSSAFEVPDPAGSSPWEVSGNADLEAGAYPDEDCAQASHELGPADPSRFDASLTPPACGRLGHQPLFVLMRRFVPGSAEHTGFPWGNSPARTMVYGAAAARVTSLTLTGAGAPRAVAIDPHGGVFLAVLDGHVDPRSLTLTARLRDGGTATFRGSVGLLESGLGPCCGHPHPSNRPLREPPVPAYRDPLPARQAEPPPPDVPLTSSVRETLHAKDPHGGPEWALRSWRGRANPRANFGGHPPRSFLCLQVGVIEGQRLLQPRPGSAALPLSVGQEGAVGGGCNAPSDLARIGISVETVSYVDNPYAYQPTPLRTVVSGQMRVGAAHPLLLGAGAPRPLTLDANRAFLAVLPGRYWDAPLRISAILKGRTIVRSAAQSFPGPPAPATPQARAPDPNGGAPWGFAAGADGSSAEGRIVDGRLAGIDTQTGTLRNGPEGWSGGGTAPIPGKRPPVRLDTQGGQYPLQPTAVLSRPEIERRTLPGRTIISGIADADVASVTLATPRDVRTLRPSGPRHVLIAVYDGQFFRGAITATVRLRNGRTVTEQVPNPGGVAGSAPPMPPLTARLRSDQNTLKGMRAQVATAERASPRQRARILRGASLVMIVQGLRQIESVVAVETARIAYLRAHPGILPPE
jgi:hypothetical protein